MVGSHFGSSQFQRDSMQGIVRLSYNTKVEKLKGKEKPNAASPLPKLERNETKLRGTRESHDTMGKHLYKLMEEVTV
jgi:hypothetical protein